MPAWVWRDVRSAICFNCTCVCMGTDGGSAYLCSREVRWTGSMQAPVSNLVRDDARRGVRVMQMAATALGEH